MSCKHDNVFLLLLLNGPALPRFDGRIPDGGSHVPRRKQKRDCVVEIPTGCEEVSLECLNSKATLTRKFAIDNVQDLSDVLAFAHQSDIYEMGEPIMLGRITGQDGAKHKILLHVIEKAAE